MDRTISQADNSSAGGFTKSVAVSSRQKFENVERLSSMMREAESSSQGAHPQQILNMIKNKIKSNYNTLYDNYDDNKTVIRKTIQQTENNDAGENAIKAKFETVIKDKNVYDRLKAEVEDKQRKLKKLMDVRDQIKNTATGTQSLRQTLEDTMVIIRYLEEHRQILEYEAAVLKNMSKDRTTVKLALKERQQIMLKEETLKKQRISKIEDTAHTKKILLRRIEEKIKKQEECEIPLPLAEELEKKLEKYQGKFAQENIIAHETKINEERAEEERALLQREQDLIAKITQAKANEDKKQFQTAYNFLLLRQAEQEKIKKLCGVESLHEIANDTLLEERQRLERIQESIERQINEKKQQNEEIRKDIETIMTTISNNDTGNLLLTVEKDLQSKETQLRRLKIHNEKKEANLNEWEAVMQMVTEGNCDRFNMAEKLQEMIGKFQDFGMRDQLENDLGERKIVPARNTITKKRGFKAEANQSNSDSQTDEFYA